MNPSPTPRKQHQLSPEAQARLEEAKKRRFAGIIAALDANRQVRDQAIKAEASHPASNANKQNP
jgi:hypothetical protein